MSLLGCAGGDYTDGSYEGSGQGYHGEVTVEVTVRRDAHERSGPPSRGIRSAKR